VNVCFQFRDPETKGWMVLTNFGVFLLALLIIFKEYGWQWGAGAVGLAYIENFALFKLFSSPFLYSITKSLALKQAQAKIAPPSTQSIDNDNNLETILETPRISDSMLNEYFDRFCINEKKVKEVVSYYNLSREDLKKIYKRLSYLGLGWIHGHYVPLSTLSYIEPLMYLIQAQQRNESDIKIASDLMAYWQDGVKLKWEPIRV
jgi:hypothetical protein